jgi:hypothetical protein
MGSRGERQQTKRLLKNLGLKRTENLSQPSLHKDNPYYRRAKGLKVTEQPEDVTLSNGTQAKAFTGTSSFSFEDAHKGLLEAAAKGGFDCDWGCTTKVQSRGCGIHAQLRGKI